MVFKIKRIVKIFIIPFLFLYPNLLAQFKDEFNSQRIYDLTKIDGLNYFKGDGNVKMSFSCDAIGFARINVDVSRDKKNIWWALIKKYVSKNFDFTQFENPKPEFRVEVKVKIGKVPKRVTIY